MQSRPASDGFFAPIVAGRTTWVTNSCPAAQDDVFFAKLRRDSPKQQVSAYPFYTKEHESWPA
jgi:hypothetical protein